MKDLKRLSEILAEMAMNQNEPFGKLFRKCPCIQAERLKQKQISLDNLTDEEVNKLVEYSFLEDWMDNQDVMQTLHISPRTLQTLRSNGTLPFSRIGNKLYYRRQDIERILKDNYTMYKIRHYGNNK